MFASIAISSSFTPVNRVHCPDLENAIPGCMSSISAGFMRRCVSVDWSDWYRPRQRHSRCMKRSRKQMSNVSRTLAVDCQPDREVAGCTSQCFRQPDQSTKAFKMLRVASDDTGIAFRNPIGQWWIASFRRHDPSPISVELRHEWRMFLREPDQQKKRVNTGAWDTWFP